jgi:hypothetical protein
MTLNARLVSDLIRHRAGFKDDSQAARIINLIPQALKETGRKLAADPFTRPLVTTDRETTLIAIGAQGKLTLTTGYNTYQFLQEYFDKGQCYFLPSSEIAGTAATGTLTISPATGAAATGYLTCSVPTGYSSGTLTVTQGVAASGSFQVVTLPVANNTITVFNRVFTFVTSSTPTSTQIQIQTTVAAQAVAIAQKLTTFAATNAALGAATYTATRTFVAVNYIALGTAGNSFWIQSNNTNVIATQQTAPNQQIFLAGGINGVQSGEVIFVNGVKCQFSDVPPPTDGDYTVYVGLPENSAGDNAVNLANALNSATNPELQNILATTNETAGTVTITYTIAGSIGNGFALANSDLGHITVSGATLTGGTGGIIENETIVINGVTFTFSNFNVGALYIPFSSVNDPVESADLIAEFLNASANSSITVATYTPSLPPPAQQSDNDAMRAVKITYDTTGTGGNAYTLANSSNGGVARSGATLTGGLAGTVVNNETVVINGVTVTFKSSAGAFPEVQIGATPTITATNLAAGLNGSANALLSVATYTSSGTVVTITYDSYGSNGNTYTLAYSSLYGVAPSGPKLTGGSGGVNITNDTFTVENYINQWADLDRVRFTDTGTLPTPLVAGTDYYIVNFTEAADGLSATFQVASNSTGTSIVNMTDTGSGILTVSKFGGSGYPMQMLSNPQQLNLPQYLSDNFQYFAVDDGYMRLIADSNGVYPVGQIAFAQPYYPTNLAALPSSAEAERVFLDTLMEIVAMPVIPNA